MIALLLTIYSVIVIVLFKLKIVKPRPYPIALIIVAGVLIIGGVYVAWMMCAPISPKVVTTQYVVQLVPYVKGQVLKVHAQPNQPMKKGDLLLEINPEPYQYSVNQLEASLQATKETVDMNKAGLQAAIAGLQKAKDGVVQAQAALDQAKAGVVTTQAALDQAKAGVANAQAALVKEKANDDLAKTSEQIALNLQKSDPGAISTLKVAEAVQNRAAADAAVMQAGASLNQAQAAQRQAESQVVATQSAQRQYEAALAEAKSQQQQAEASVRQSTFTLKVSESNVPAVRAQLDEARFNLAQCKMYAPSDGYVVNWQVQEGTMLVPMPLTAAGTFINTSETSIAAAFPQNYLMNVEPGNEVELVFDTFPGRLFKGEVENVIEATGEGQYTTSGNIPYAAKIGSFGMLAVKIRLTGEDRSTPLALGTGGTVAIYTDHGKPVHIVSKVTIRMKKWLLYVLPTLQKPS
jgi:multidrug resistance efflux pump